MDIHIPTLFLTLTAASTVLALALAFVAFRSRRDGMPLWALAIACHALAYLLFSLRDQAPYIFTVVGANFLLTASLAIFGEGLYQFHQRRPPRLVLWLPVALSLGVTASLPDNLEGRIFLSGIINGWQGLLLLALILRQRQATRGRGQYLLMAGFATMLALSALRSGATALGKMDIATLTATNPVQALSFMATLATLILVAVGVVVMTKEQAEVRLVHNQAFSRGILNAIISEIAVLDHRGVIIEVNDAWQRFAIANSSVPGTPAPATGLGTNYLEICDSAASQSAAATSARDGIRQILDGSATNFSMEYDCHCPHQQRWFMMTVAPLGTHSRMAVVVHTDITERILAEQRIRAMAYHDPLTKLPNRSLLADRLAQAQAGNRRSGRHGALMFLDLDNFKALNDRHGHALGDLLLMEVARRLKECVREADTVARVGGDEFVVMLNSLNSDLAVAEKEAATIAETVRQALAQPYHLDGETGSLTAAKITHNCTVSIGVALFGSVEISQDDILHRGDQAMYLAKDGGRNRVCFYRDMPLESAESCG